MPRGNRPCRFRFVAYNIWGLGKRIHDRAADSSARYRMKDPYRHSRNPESSVTSVKEPGEDLFRLLVHRVKDYAIFLLDPKGVVISWNEGAERIKGYAAHEIIGRHFSTFYPQDAIDRRWPEHELTVAQAEGRFEDAGWRIRKDGT